MKLPNLLNGYLNSMKKIIDILCSNKSIFIFASCFLLLTYISFCFITSQSIIATYGAYIIFVFGAVILLAALFRYKKYKLNTILITIFLFCGSYLLSSLIMSKYGISSNIKGFIWLIFESIIIFSLCKKNIEDKYLIWFLKLFITISVLYSLISIIMALSGYMYYPTNIDQNNLIPGGMAHGRLYGMYSDPNYGSVISIIAIISTFYIYINKKSKINLIFAIMFSLINIVYISLSGSRTGILTITIASIIIGFLISHKLVKIKSNLFNIFISLFISGLSCFVVIAILFSIGPIYDNVIVQICAQNGGSITDPKHAFTVAIADKIRNENNIADPYQATAKSDNNQNSTENKSNNDGSNANRAIDPADVNTEHSGLLGRDESKGGVTNNRSELWKDALNLFIKSPIIGVSNRNYNAYAKEFIPDSLTAKAGFTSSHNSILDVLASQGIIGILIWLFFLAIITWTLIKNTLSSKGIAYYKYTFLLSIFSVIFVSSLLIPDMIYVNSVSSVFFWYVFGHLPCDKINVRKDK